MLHFCCWCLKFDRGVFLLPFQDDRTIEPLTYGRISSYYYLKHQTIRMFKERLRPELSVQDLLSILSVRLPLALVLA